MFNNQLFYFIKVLNNFINIIQEFFKAFYTYTKECILELISIFFFILNTEIVATITYYSFLFAMYIMCIQLFLIFSELNLYLYTELRKMTFKQFKDNGVIFFIFIYLYVPIYTFLVVYYYDYLLELKKSIEIYKTQKILSFENLLVELLDKYQEFIIEKFLPKFNEFLKDLFELVFVTDAEIVASDIICSLPEEYYINNMVAYLMVFFTFSIITVRLWIWHTIIATTLVSINWFTITYKHVVKELFVVSCLIIFLVIDFYYYTIFIYKFYLQCNTYFNKLFDFFNDQYEKIFSLILNMKNKIFVEIIDESEISFFLNEIILSFLIIVILIDFFFKSINKSKSLKKKLILNQFLDYSLLNIIIIIISLIIYNMELLNYFNNVLISIVNNIDFITCNSVDNDKIDVQHLKTNNLKSLERDFPQFMTIEETYILNIVDLAKYYNPKSELPWGSFLECGTIIVDGLSLIVITSDSNDFIYINNVWLQFSKEYQIITIHEIPIFNDILVVNKINLFFKILTFIFFLFFFYIIKLNKKGLLNFELVLTLIFTLFCTILLFSANDLIFLYILLEAQTICFYILTCIFLNSFFSIEALIKYFLIGALTSSLLLFGILLIYNSIGLTNFVDLEYFTLQVNNNINFKLGLIIISISLLLKIGSAPFHFWIVDTYVGITFFSFIVFHIIPKLTYIYILIQIMFKISGSIFDIKQRAFYFIKKNGGDYDLKILNIEFSNNIFKLLLFFGILSFIIGIFGTIGQINLKKFFVYSSITNIGFLLILLSIMEINSLKVILLYLVVYTFLLYLNLSYIQILKILSIKPILTFLDLPKLNYIGLNLTFVLSLFSLAGLPPFSGFFIKVYTYTLLVSNKFFILTAFLIVLTNISIFYYIRFTVPLFFSFSNQFFSFSKYISISKLLKLIFFSNVSLKKKYKFNFNIK